MMTSSDLGINSLPDSVLIGIFSYLDQVELHLSVSRVCKRWDILAYDQELWRKFNLHDYSQHFSCLIDTRGFHLYILQRINSHIRHLKCTETGLVLLPLLERIGLPRLQTLTLPLCHKGLANESNAELLSTVKKIHESTRCRLYSDFSHCPDYPVFIGKPFSWNETLIVRETHNEYNIVKGIETFKAAKCDGKYIKLDLEKYNSVSVSIPCSINNFHYSIFKQLADFEHLQELRIQLIGQIFEILNETELKHLCRNLISLKLYNFKEEVNVGKLLSYANSLRFLCLSECSAACLSNLSNICKNLTELQLCKIDQLTDPQNSYLLCDIAHHCSELARISLDGVHGTVVNNFLQMIPHDCKKVNYIELCGSLYHSPLIEKNTLVQLIIGCPLLKTLKSFRYNIEGGVLLESVKASEMDICLEELRLFVLKSSGLDSIAFELSTLGHMAILSVLQLISNDGVFVFVETVQTISKMCPNLTDLTLDECCKYRVQVPFEQYNNFDTETLDDKGGAILAQLFLPKLRKLCFHLMCKCLQSMDVQNLLDRSPSLVQLSLGPICDDSDEELTVKLGPRPHKLRFIGKTLKLTILCENMYKQLTCPTWKDTWHSKNNVKWGPWHYCDTFL